MMFNQVVCKQHGGLNWIKSLFWDALWNSWSFDCLTRAPTLLIADLLVEGLFDITTLWLSGKPTCCCCRCITTFCCFSVGRLHALFSNWTRLPCDALDLYHVTLTCLFVQRPCLMWYQRHCKCGLLCVPHSVLYSGALEFFCVIDA